MRALLVAALPAYVALSGVLAFAGGDPTALPDAPSNAWRAWREHPLPDLVFVLGSAATGVFAWRTARRSLPSGLALAFAGTWATYAATFAAAVGAGVLFFGALFPFVVALAGWMGLAFATVAPVLAALPARGGTFH